MGRFRDLSIRVTSVDREPVQSAQVTAERDGQTVATVTTNERGRAEIERDDERELLIRVEAAGLEGDQRAVSGERPEHLEVFVLGRPGLPFFYRDTVKVPFEPVTDAVGVVPAGAGERPAERVAAVADAAGSLGAEVIRSGGNFATGGVAVVGLPAEARRGREPAPSVEELLDRLAGSRAVERAGALVHLTDEDASFLTDTVIAQFGDEVDDNAAAEIAARHGLRDEGRIEALGNVHTLRFDGPATYAVLDASNALMDEPQVVFAEPDLVHTVAEDSPVIPTDFLFPQQWDHPIIDTPNAWQALSDLDPTLTFGSPDVIIAVIDTGVDLTHPEFVGRVSNGSPKVHKVYDFENGAANMDDLDRDHGTACASAAVAAANNPSAVAGVNEGIAGVAGNCRLIAVRRGGSELRYAIAYLWAAGLQVPPLIAPDRISPGADVISSSFGVSNDQPISGLMRNTFNALTRDGRQGRGTVLLFSAGNDNVDLDTTFRRPWSMYERCFGVAASTLDNTGVTEDKAGYSDFGSTVDFCAPSDDDQGIHNPPLAFGANAATIQAEPIGDGIPGRPDNQTTLTVAAATGATVLTVGTTAGMAVGQAVLIGAPGAAGTENRLITAVNAAANRVTVQPALLSAHGIGTAVASGPHSYRSNFGGTSYATPVCAGTAALILSAAPHLRWEQVGDILTQTAIKIDPNNTNATGRWRDGAGRISTDPAYTGPVFSEFYGAGRISASAAVRQALATAVQGEFYATDSQRNIGRLAAHSGWRSSWTIIVPGNFGGDGPTDLLFYDPSAGHGEFWTTDGQGNIAALRLHEGWRSSWAAIVPGNFGGSGHTDLLFYDPSAGHGVFYTTDGQGNMTQLSLHEGWRSSWTAIVPGNFGGSGHTDLLFYDPSNGHGVFYTTDGQGNMTQLSLHEGWRSSWTAIVPGNFGGSGHTDLLFYDPSNGHGVFYTTDGQGNMTELRLHEGWRQSWRTIVPGNFGGSAHSDLLFYDPTLGQGELWTTDGQGGIGQPRLHEGLRPSWRAIVPGDFGGGVHTDLLFYDPGI